MHTMENLEDNVKRKHQTPDSSLKNDQQFANNLATLANAPIPGLTPEILTQFQTRSMMAHFEYLADKIKKSNTLRTSSYSAPDRGIPPHALLRDINIGRNANGFALPFPEPYVHSSVGLSLPFLSSTKAPYDAPSSATSKKRRILERKNASMPLLKPSSVQLNPAPTTRTVVDAGPCTSALSNFSSILPFPLSSPFTCPSLPPTHASLFNMISIKHVRPQHVKPHASIFSPTPLPPDYTQKHKDYCIKLLKNRPITGLDRTDERDRASKASMDFSLPPTSNSDKYVNLSSKNEKNETKTLSKNKRKTFPRILYQMLQEKSDHETTVKIISWLPDGKCFQIHNKIDFEQGLLRKYFNGIKFRSFQRQLNIYEFERLEEYKYPTYKHIFFVRDQDHLINNVKRVPIKKEHT